MRNSAACALDCVYETTGYLSLGQNDTTGFTQGLAFPASLLLSILLGRSGFLITESFFYPANLLLFSTALSCGISLESGRRDAATCRTVI
jgi:hypothetical protein